MRLPTERNTHCPLSAVRVAMCSRCEKRAQDIWNLGEWGWTRSLLLLGAEQESFSSVRGQQRRGHIWTLFGTRHPLHRLSKWTISYNAHTPWIASRAPFGNERGGQIWATWKSKLKAHDTNGPWQSLSTNIEGRNQWRQSGSKRVASGTTGAKLKGNTHTHPRYPKTIQWKPLCYTQSRQLKKVQSQN